MALARGRLCFLQSLVNCRRVAVVGGVLVYRYLFRRDGREYREALNQVYVRDPDELGAPPAVCTGPRLKIASIGAMPKCSARSGCASRSLP